jgi:hypothetical protein
MNVRLGYEVGTGAPVDIPIAHMIVTGQTQLSGKTTTLEALVSRASSMRALAFRTKRGEGAFVGQDRIIQPYFRQRTDWQFVASVLEAETREKMRFERAWIMKAVRGADSLAGVRRNLTKLQAKSKRSMDQDVYMVLGAYLDAVLPVLARVTFADRVYLRQGLSVVDLGALPVNVQGLVISSMLSWVHEQERGVTVILPESWKYIPQGRNSPVKMAAVSLAREGAGIGNLLWLDSQDLAGAEKEIVRQASVYLMGVQREVNEVKRALAHIPAGIKKPRAEDLATLKRGEFFACWGERTVKTYVQPAWMDAEKAQKIARGAEDVDTAIALTIVGHDLMLEGEKLNAQRRGFQMDRWDATGALPAPPPVETLKTWEPEPILVSPETLRRIERLNEEDEMNAEQEKKLDRLVDAVTSLVERIDNPVRTVTMDERPMLGTVTPPHPGVDNGMVNVTQVTEAVIDRLRTMEPKLLKVLLERPELRVEVKKETITADGKSLRGRLARMILDSDFSGDGLNGKAATRALTDAGFKCAHPQVYAELDALTEMGFLRTFKRSDGERRYVEVELGDRLTIVTK